MSGTEKPGSIFQEMAERRSRSEDLNAKAAEQGIAVVNPMVSTEVEGGAEIEIECRHAFEVEAPELPAVSGNEIRDEELDPAIESVDTAAEAEPEQSAADEPLAQAPRYFESLDEPAFEAPAPIPDDEEDVSSLEAEFPAEPAPVFSEPLPDAVEPSPADEAPLAAESLGSEDLLGAAVPVGNESDREPSYFASLEDAEPESELASPPAEDAGAVAGLSSEATRSPVSEPLDAHAEEAVLEEGGEAMERAPEPKETAPIAQEALIEQSDDLLGESPELVSDAEVIQAAEALVDRIGPVVDIQSLPKTQPSRVLSKTTKPVEPPPEATPTAAEPEPAAAQEAEGESPRAEEAPTSPKKKKKKISLLDSYFKGL